MSPFISSDGKVIFSNLVKKSVDRENDEEGCAVKCVDFRGLLLLRKSSNSLPDAI